MREFRVTVHGVYDKTCRRTRYETRESTAAIHQINKEFQHRLNKDPLNTIANDIGKKWGYTMKKHQVIPGNNNPHEWDECLHFVKNA
jgi:hypothetical protein